MNTAVVYWSMTGHSKKIANAIATKINAEALNIKKKPVLENVDLLFIVGGIYGGKSSPSMLDYLRTLDSSKVKKAVLLTSSASDKTGQDEVREVLQSRKIEVASDEYRCRGGFIFMKIGHPNKKEVVDAIEFASKFIS